MHVREALNKSVLGEYVVLLLKNSPLLLKYVDFRHISSRSATLSGERVVLSANVSSCQDCRVLGEITLIHLAEAQLWWAGMEKESRVWCYVFNHFQKNPEVVVQLCHHSLSSDQSLAGAMRAQDPISIVLRRYTYLIASHFQLIGVCFYVKIFYFDWILCSTVVIRCVQYQKAIQWATLMFLSFRCFF